MKKTLVLVGFVVAVALLTTTTGFAQQETPPLIPPLQPPPNEQQQQQSQQQPSQPTKEKEQKKEPQKEEKKQQPAAPTVQPVPVAPPLTPLPSPPRQETAPPLAPLPVPKPVPPQPKPQPQPQTKQPSAQQPQPTPTPPQPTKPQTQPQPAPKPSVTQPAPKPAPQPKPAPKPTPKPQPPKKPEILEMPVPTPTKQEPKPQKESTQPQQGPTPGAPGGFTVTDTEFPPPKIEEKPKPEPELKFKYRGEIRTRFGFDTVEEYGRFFNPLKSADSDDRYFYAGCEDVLDWRSSLFFSSQLEFSEKLWSRLELYLEYAVLERRNEDGTTILVNGDHPRAYFDWKIMEAFLSWEDALPGLSFKFGHQVVNLGVLDAHSVVEHISPPDMNALYWSDFTVPRLPVWAVRADYTHEWFSAMLLWQPVFSQPDIDLYGSDFSLLRPGVPIDYPRNPKILPDLSVFLNRAQEFKGDRVLLTTEEQLVWPQNSAVAVKLGASVAGADLALLYSYAYEDVPSITYDPILEKIAWAISEGKDNIAMKYIDEVHKQLQEGKELEDFYKIEFQRTHQLGFIINYGFWKIGLKGELAFEWNKTYLDAFTLQAVHHDTLSYAAGIDFTQEDDIYIALELYGSYLIDAEEDERFMFVTRGNLGLWGLVRLQFLDDDLTIELVADGRFNTHELILSPRVGYEVVENLRLYLGAMFLECFSHERGGFDTIGMSNDDRKDTFAGRYSNNDQIYLLLKYAF